MSYALHKTTLFGDFHLESEEPVYKVSGGCQSQNKEETVSLGVFEQVKWERDIALGQLKELGYGFGEKIRTDEDCISRKSVLDTTICEGISCNECSFNEIDGEPGCLLHKRIDDLPSVKPKERTGEWKQGEIDWYKLGKCIEEGFRKGLKE